MGTILAFFAGNKIRVIGFAVIAIALVLGYSYVSNLRSKVAELTATNTLLKDKIKTQNAAVEAFKLAADTRLAEAQEQLRVAQEKADLGKTEARIIYKTAPSRGTATCEADRQSTLDLMNRRATK